jgi:hypothetical protein
MNIKQRINKPTPKFFKKIRNIGLTLLAVSTAVATAPIALPVVIVKVAGYLAVAGGVASAISQTTTTKEDGNTPQQ